MYINSKSNKSIIIYLNTNEKHPYAYKDKNYTIKYSKDELENAFLTGCVTYANKNYEMWHIPYTLNIFENYCSASINMTGKCYSSEYIEASTN